MEVSNANMPQKQHNIAATPKCEDAVNQDSAKSDSKELNVANRIYKKKKIDRTVMSYKKRKRKPNRCLGSPQASTSGFKKGDIVWSLWAESDGVGGSKKKRDRPVKLSGDLSKKSKDFEDAHEVISAFLMVVTSDAQKGSNKTSVVRIQNDRY